MLAPEYGGDNQKRAEPGKYPDPVVAFPAHWAPMQMTFYAAQQFPAKYRGGAFVAFHGSWNRAPRPQKGYNVAFVPFDDKGMPAGGYETFASGFPGRGNSRSPEMRGTVRPASPSAPTDRCTSPTPRRAACGASSTRVRSGTAAATAAASAAPRAVASPRSAAAAPAAPSAAPSSAAAAADSPGAKLYALACSTCHMPDGSGVAGLQPALVGSKVVSGPPATLIKVLLLGPEKALPARKAASGNQMPQFDSLSDEDIASILTYVRKAFGKGASAVTPAQVKAQRPK